MAPKLNGLVGGLAGVLLLTVPLAAQQPSRPNGPDQELVTRLHQLGQDEIAASGLGVVRGERPGVRTFAATIQREHRVADDVLLAYAVRQGMDRVSVAEPGGALPHGTLALAPLVNSSNAEFDYNFASKMVADHQAAIDAAAAAERLARDPELKALIDADIKMMTNHLVAAQELLAGIPAPRPRALGLPAFPAGVSRTQTGADTPPPAALPR